MKLPWWAWLVGGAAMLGGGAAVTIAALGAGKDRAKFASVLFAAVSSSLSFLSVRARVLVVAQAALESGWGDLGNGRGQSNNVFNITAGSSWLKAGKPTVGGTDHDAAGNVIGQTWRAYPDLSAALVDYWAVLSLGYSQARAVLQSPYPDVNAFANALGHGEYGSFYAGGTGVSYASALASRFAEVSNYLAVDVG